MKKTSISCALVAILAAPWASSGPQVPQNPRDGGGSPGSPPGDSTWQPLERDSFTYVVAGRRDPFQPIASPDRGDLDLREVRLLGIISHGDPDLSVAVISVSRDLGVNGAGSSDTALQPPLRESHRLRTGDRVGSVRVVSIHKRHVVVEVAGAGRATRRLLSLGAASGGSL